MTATREKVGAIFFSLLMIVSMSIGSVVVSGAAAADTTAVESSNNIDHSQLSGGGQVDSDPTDRGRSGIENELYSITDTPGSQVTEDEFITKFKSKRDITIPKTGQGNNAAGPDADTLSPSDSISSTNVDTISVGIVAQTYGPGPAVIDGERVRVVAGAIEKDGVTPVENISMTVTLINQDNRNETVLTENATTDSEGNIALNCTPQAQPDGIYRLVAEASNYTASDSTEIRIGPEPIITTTTAFSSAAFVNEEAQIGLRLLDNRQPISDEFGNIEITDPDGNVAETLSPTTDDTGTTIIRFTPKQEGTYTIQQAADNNLGINTRVPVSEYIAEVSPEEYTAGGQLSIPGYIYGSDGPYANSEVRLRIYDDRPSRPGATEIAVINATTNAQGLFVARGPAPSNPGRYYYELEAPLGSKVPLNFVENRFAVENATNEDDTESASPSLTASFEQGFDARYSRGDTATAQIQLTDQADNPISDANVRVSFRYGFSGPIASSTVVQTDSNGEATSNFAIPETAPRGVEIRVAAEADVSGTTVTASDFGGPIQDHFIKIPDDRRDFDPEAGEQAEVPVNVTDGDGNPVSNITYTYDIQRRYLHNTFKTGIITTDANGRATIPVQVPATAAGLDIVTGGRHEPDGRRFIAGGRDQDLSGVLIDLEHPDPQLTISSDRVAPGETITVSYGNTSASTGIISLTSFDTLGSENRVAAPGETVEFTIPETATSDDSFEVNVLAVDDNRTRYVEDEFLFIPEDAEPIDPDPTPFVTAPSDRTYDPTTPSVITTSHNTTGVIDNNDVAIRLVNVTGSNDTVVGVNSSVPAQGNVNTTIPAGTLSGNATIETQLYNLSSQRVVATDIVRLTETTGDKFDVSIDSNASDTSIIQGANLTVAVGVENVGDASGSQTVAVDLLNETENGTRTPVFGPRESIELKPEENTTIKTAIQAGRLAPGNYTLTAYSENVEDNLNVTIREEADLGIAITEFDDSVVAGENLSVTADITNISKNTRGEQIRFAVDGDIIETRPVDPSLSKTDYDVSGQRGIALADDSIYVTEGENILEIDRESGETVSQFTAPEGVPRGLTYADGSLWFTDTTEDNFEGGIVELDPETGAVQSRITNNQYDPTDLAYEDGSLWVLEITSNSVRELDPDTGNQLSQFGVGGPLSTTAPRALAYQNDTLWVGTADTNELGQFTTDGNLIQRTGKRATSYRSLASDGAALYGPGTDGNLTVLRQFDDADPTLGNQTTETFVYQTNESDVPEIVAEVTSESANDSVAVSVTEPEAPDRTDRLVVDSIQEPNTIGQTQRLSVSATITNPTPSNSTESVEFVLDADQDGSLETVSTRELTLAPGANTTVGFTAPSSLAPGTYDYGITAATENERQVTVVGADFKTAVSTGDPHIVTFDGVAYDYMAAGEYTLVREPTGSLNIQARQEPVGGSDSVTINTALATVLDGQSVVIDVTDSTPVQINGTPTPIGDGNAVTVGDGTIERSGSSYVIVYPGENDTPDPTDERVIVDTFGNRIDIEVRLDSDREAPVEGVLGNVDGNSSNDIALANGTVVSDPSDSNELYGSFRNDWRVTENTTLFDYEGDNGPETYYDPAIPRGSFSVNDIDQDTRSEAEELAADAGLTPGTSAYRNALIDYALTGDESYFSSAQQQNASTDVNETVTPSVPPELNGSNTLSVTATNASGDVVPGAEIKLYNDSFVILDSRQADQNGVASWSTLVPGEYNVELYGPDGAFWGGTSVTVDADGTNSTVRRTAPRLSRINLDGDENGEGGFYGGRPVAIGPVVQNDGPERPVRVRIQVDTNNDSSAEKNVLRGGFGTNISSGGSGFYGYEYDPSTNGTKQVKIVSETYLNNNWTITDASGWYKKFNIENNIVGYDPQKQNYSNITLSSTEALPISTTATLPRSLSQSGYSPLLPSNGQRRVTETSDYPWSAVGNLAVNDSGYMKGYCSGTVVENRHIITAAHCVYDSKFSNKWLIGSQLNGQQVGQIYFLPGRSDIGQSPIVANVTYIHIYKHWTSNQNRGYDIAVLTLNKSVGEQTGTFGYEGYSPSRTDVYGEAIDSDLAGRIEKTPAHVTGYPSFDAPYVQDFYSQHDFKANGEGTQVTTDLACAGTNLCHDIATGGVTNELIRPGVSGGPVWQNQNNRPEMISIASAGPKVPELNVDIPGNTERVDIDEFFRGLVLEPLSDSTATRISQKKDREISQMINHGYAETSATNPNSRSDIPSPSAGRESGSATGDPHLTTYDGVAYDFQAAGEFILTNDSDGNPYVQARLRPVASRDVSVISAVATQLNGTNVTIDARDDQMLTVGGTAQSLATGESMTVDNGEIFRTPEKYIVVYPGADDEVDDGDSRLEATVAGDRLDVVVKPNRTAVDSMTGLLGSPDGNPDNDLMRADGTTLSAQPSFAELYGQYREDYRVTAENSLFDYDAGESAAGFYDPNYPSEQVTVDDLSADEREDAIDAATNAGLEPGTAAFHDAVLDYALTGNRSYLASAALTAEETDVTEDATPPDTPLTAPNLTVDTDQLATADDPLTVAVEAEHPNPDNVTLIISNGTGTVLSQEVSGAFTSEQTVSWNTTVAGEQVADGVYTLGVVATTDAGVRNVTTRGILVDNTAPSVTVETNSTTLSANADSATIRFSYNDAASGVDPASITVLEDGANVTGSAQINATHVNYRLTGLTPGETRTVQVQVADEAGLTTNETATVSVASSGGTGTGGGSGDSSSGDSTDDFPLIDVDPTLTEEVDVEQQTTEFDEADTVSRVTFDQGTQGSVTVSEFDGLPDSTVGTIVERIAEDATAIDSSLEIDFVTVVDISPDSLSSDQSSATVELEVPSEQLDDPENAVIIHRTATGWAIQETTVQDVSGGTVTLTAPVDSFSLFAVVERSPSQATTPTPTSPQATPGGTPEPEPETTSVEGTRTPEPPEAVDTQQTTSAVTEPGGFNLLPSVIILVLVGVVIAAIVILRRRNML